MLAFGQSVLVVAVRGVAFQLKIIATGHQHLRDPTCAEWNGGSSFHGLDACSVAERTRFLERQPPMATASINAGARTIAVAWPDGTTADFPFLWLRDNCPTGLHPETHERTFELLSVPDTLAPVGATIETDCLVIRWPDHTTELDLDWLAAHRPGERAHDPADVSPVLWRGTVTKDALPSATASSLLDSDRALSDWLKTAKAHGLALVTELDDRVDAGMEIARRIGFLRETNFGVEFDVVSKPDPNNLAYTAGRLPLHTDLPNQELPPGFQFLHCIANSADGGGSMFCDGFAVADAIQKEDPAAFDLLASQPIPLRFHDATCDIRKRDTVIRRDFDGRLQEVRFNAHIAATFDMPAHLMSAYYRAYRMYMAMSRSAAFEVTLRLEPCEMVVFDNRRVLHGRDAFDPSTGHRHLHGCYVDRGEWDSRMRVLARNVD